MKPILEQVISNLVKYSCEFVCFEGNDSPEDEIHFHYYVGEFCFICVLTFLTSNVCTVL